ncbi:MAG: hypothetical protein U5M23_01470 [Marinagarivorans sp.]|nr:hypothetical protein [Marinagarivorans sp.]
MNNFSIFGQFKTLSPLSHIGESISTVTYLVQDPIMQQCGGIEEVFCYNGNAFRGQLRDLAARYMLDKLNMTVSIDAFHLLFSGGKIGGDQSIDIAQARIMRKAVPMIGLFGGGVGNQILPGKLRVGSSYPLCVEALPVLPFIDDDSRKVAIKCSYRQMTMEKSFTRMDDSKDPRLADVVSLNDAHILEGTKGKKKDGEVSTQMRMTSELLIPGVTLAHKIDLIGASDIELGALVSAFDAFSSSPYIGGQCNRGHGLVSYSSKVVNMTTGEVHDFVKINGDGPARLSKVAQSAKDAYDTQLLAQYNEFIASKESEIRGLLGAAPCGQLL